jgi:hypothetical protein
MITPREIRFLKELVENERVSVKDLRQRIGALNPAQVKLYLVRRGWKIDTGYIPMVDRDGKFCRPDYYMLASGEKERARSFLESASRAVHAALHADSNPELSNSKTLTNHNKEGEK